MRIALVQTPCVLGDKIENLDRMRRMVQREEADLYVFPELFLTGYMVRDEVFRLAEGVDGGSVEAVRKLADEHGASILFGMPLWDPDIPGVLRNSAVLITPNGVLQRYDKVNLASFGPFEERLYFAPGRDPGVMEVDGVKIGAVICYDLFFPELAKDYALMGAEAVICLSASPITSRDFFERIIPARAVENTVYSIYVNQVGTQLNQVFFGGAEAVCPRGNRLAKNKYFEEDLSVIEASREELVRARIGRPTIRDTI